MHTSLMLGLFYEWNRFLKNHSKGRKKSNPIVKCVFPSGKVSYSS